MPALPLPQDTRSQQYWTAEYWAQKGDVKLYLYRKQLTAPVSRRIASSDCASAIMSPVRSPRSATAKRP
jgi:hypothetical protein